MKAFTTGPFTGRHITMIMVAFFGVVIAVNLIMARYATSTFGGVVVKNSYVASQQYNVWLKEAEKEKAMGWSAAAERRADGRIAVALARAPKGAVLTGDAWHPLGRLPDQPLTFTRQSDGSFLSGQPLPAGRWRLRIEARAGEQRWRTELDLR